jgi:hypothetical protein
MRKFSSLYRTWRFSTMPTKSSHWVRHLTVDHSLASLSRYFFFKLSINVCLLSQIFSSMVPFLQMLFETFTFLMRAIFPAYQILFDLIIIILFHKHLNIVTFKLTLQRYNWPWNTFTYLSSYRAVNTLHLVYNKIGNVRITQQQDSFTKQLFSWKSNTYFIVLFMCVCPCVRARAWVRACICMRALLACGWMSVQEVVRMLARV